MALDSRLAVAVMQRERDAMRAALQEREAEAARQAARVAGLQGELGGARAALADLRLDLAEERRRALALADALARGACGDASPGGRPGTPGQRALREAMSAARAELAEKEAQLAACMEDLMLERRRCAELHAQTLDQAGRGGDGDGVMWGWRQSAPSGQGPQGAASVAAGRDCLLQGTASLS